MSPGAKKNVSFSDDEDKGDEQIDGQGTATEAVMVEEGGNAHGFANASNENADGFFSNGGVESQAWARGELGNDLAMPR